MENDYDIPLDDLGTPYVTIEDMQELLKGKENAWEEDGYVGLRLDKKTGLLYTDYFSFYSPELLYSHLLVEQCLEHIDQVDWKRVTNGYDNTIIDFLQHKWENPLVWLDEIPDDEELTTKYVITGKVATELSSEMRNTCEPYCQLWADLQQKRVLWLADDLPTANDLTRPHFNSEDLVLWYLITADNISLYFPELYNDGGNRRFNVREFRRNIAFIAQERGGKRAAEIVQLFRKDWPDIKAMKLFGVDELTPEQIAEFEQCLFAGMDRNLRKWEAETQEEQTSKTTPCRYIDLDKLVEMRIHTPEEFTRSLRQACEQDAPTLGAFLKKNYKLGYLDFHGDGKKKIYEHLKECFPQGLNYSYTNFTLYFD